MADAARGSAPWRRLWWSLAGRIWLTSLMLVLVMAALGVITISRLGVLESSVNSVLSRNYRSIEAAHGMLAAVNGLRTGDLSAALAPAEFHRWLEIQQHNLTEPGEGELTAKVAKEGDAFFARDIHAPDSAAQAQTLSNSLKDLIALNRHAMFSADRHTVRVAHSFRTEELFLVAFGVLLLALSSYALARTLVTRPLGELLRTLRQIGDEQSLRAMTSPPTLELDELAREFNAMVARLQTGYRARVDELSRERSKSSAIIESIEDGLIVLDHAGIVVHINEIACAILDVEPAHALAMPFEGIGRLSPHSRRMIEALEHNRETEGTPTEFKVFVRGRDHSYLARDLPWREQERDAADGSGGNGGSPKILGTIILLQDVTLIRDQERRHNSLIATLSHELKTPLTSLSIGSELLAESMSTQLTERQHEILSTLREDAGRLQAIATDLLDASRSSAARIGVERSPILLDSILYEVCKPLKLQAEEKGLTLETIAAERPVPIWGDPIKLPWVITNLVGNALRYTPAGGKITVELKREEKIARVTVADNGPGIPSEIVDRIFEPYAQFPDNPARAGSAGLGLYIAKEIVEAHNGRIYVHSVPGRGSNFIVEIPLREQALG